MVSINVIRKYCLLFFLILFIIFLTGYSMSDLTGRIEAKDLLKYVAIVEG